MSGELGPEHRPALRALLQAVRSGTVARVVVRHLDRLGRGVVLEETIAELRANAVELWSFDGRQDIHSAAGWLGVRAQAMVGAFEVERTGERVREMKRQKARAGIYMGPTPYGYTSQARLVRELTADYGPGREADAKEDAEEAIPHRGKLVTDPDEAEVVREIFRLYLTGKLGCRRVANELSRLGHRTREGYRWSAQSVLKVVRDPKVAGYVTFDEIAYEAHTPSSAPIQSQTHYPAKHEAIISKATWDAAQVLREGVGAIMKAIPASGRTYALRGVVWCEHGHRAKSKSTGKGGKAYYTCMRRCLHGVDPGEGGCDGATVPVEVAESAVRDVLARLLTDPRQLHDYLVAANKAAQGTAKPKDRAGDIELEVSRLEASRTRYYRLLEATEPGSDEERVSLDRVVELKRRIQALKEEAEEAGRVVPLPATVRMEQVQAFVDRLATLEDLGALVAVLHRDHDLRVEMVSTSQVRVSLDVDPGALGSAPRLVATARIKVGADGGAASISLAVWVRRQNDVAPSCACGCGEQIVVRDRHRSMGIPRFVHGHAFKTDASRRGEVPAGWLTVGEAAKAWGVGVTSVRRMADAGGVAVRWVELRGKRSRLVRRS